MCFNKKRFDKIDAQLSELKSERIEKLQSDSDELKQIKELLSYIRFSVKKIIRMDDGTVKVTYEVPSQIVPETGRNNMFYAINMLELISYEDMAKIQRVMEGE